MKNIWKETLEKVYEEIYCGDSGYAELEEFVKNLLAEQKKELIEEIKEELRTWINDNNVDFNGTDVTYTAELANYVDNKLKHND